MNPKAVPSISKDPNPNKNDHSYYETTYNGFTIKYTKATISQILFWKTLAGSIDEIVRILPSDVLKVM